MELDQLETFLAVASFGGFHRAAEALHISQPAISARIKALEISLGAQLLVRSRSGFTLSAAGRSLRPHAEQLLRAAAQARQAVQELRPDNSGPLQIAAALSICVYFLPDVLKQFQKTHPKLVINLRSGHSKGVLDMVLEGEAEIGLARSLNHPEVETISLRDDPLLLMAGPTRKKNRLRSAKLEEVAAWPLIFYERGSSDWSLTQSLFRRAGMLPNAALEVDSIETAKRMVERGLGLAFLPRIAVAKELRLRRLSVVRITDAEPLARSLDVVHARRRPLRPEVKSFLAVVRNAANETADSAEAGVERRKRPR